MDAKLYLNMTISPYCFDFNFLKQDFFSNPAKLKELLKVIKDKSLWIQDKYQTSYLIYQFINNYTSYSFQKDIMELLEVISNKVVNCYESNFECENTWHNNISLNLKDYLHHIIMTENFLHETIDDDSRGIPIEEQNEERVKQFLQPIIPYAKIIKIYDPFFSFHERDNRFEKFLQIIIDLLHQSLCNDQKPNIEIYTSYKNKSLKKLKDWQKYFIQFYNEYNLKFTGYIFKEDFHDRYLLTNFCGIQIGRGTDIGSKPIATWTLLRDGEIDTIIKHFNILGNNPKNRLKYKITKDAII